MGDRRCSFQPPGAARCRSGGTLLALLAALLALGVPARAQIPTITTDTTISSANSINADEVWVTGSARVTLVAGGSISGSLFAYDTSTIDVEGGSIYRLTTLRSATANISGGSIQSLTAQDMSRITITGSCLSLSLPAINGVVTSYLLTGTLSDGTPLNMTVYTVGSGQIVLDSAPLQLACGADVTAATAPGQCSASVTVAPPTPTGHCGTPMVGGRRSDGKPLTDPYPVGRTTITWTAIDGSSQAQCPQTVTVTPTYAWSGVLPPIKPNGSSVFKAGSTVPVSFTLATSACVSAGSVAATLSWQPVSGTAVNAAVSTSAASSGNQFRYDPTSGQYIFNWNTKGLAPGTYELQIDLGDGVPRTVSLGLK